MDEVSGRFAKWVYESGISDGVPEDILLAKVNVSAEVLADGKVRIDWDDYVQLLENYHGELGLDGMQKSAYRFGTTVGLDSFGTMAGLFLSPRRLYRFMYSWVGSHFLRNVSFELSEEADGSMKLVSAIDVASRGSEVYFLTLTNVLAGSTLRIGCEPADVKIASIGSHRAEYRLVMPKRGVSLSHLMSWPKRFLRSRTLEKEILVRLQEEICEQQVALSRQQKDFSSMIESQSEPLFIVEDGGEALFVNRIARRWFMVPEELGGWKPEEAVDPESADRWKVFVEMRDGDSVEEEFTFRRKDQGGAEVNLSFSPAQAVMFANNEAWLLVGRDVTQRRRVESQMREVAFAERQKLAHEIHDDLGQQLTGIALRSESLSMELTALAPEKASSASGIASEARKAVERARDLAHGLAAIDERPDNLRRGLSRHAEEVRIGTAFRVVLDLPEEPLTMAGQEALEVLRIVQEACHNSVKHSGGSLIQIRVALSDSQWRICIADDGGGMPDEMNYDPAGMGLGSMLMRARQLGGSLKISNGIENGVGTELVIRLPRSDKEELVAQPEMEHRSGEREIRVVVADDHEFVLDGQVARLSHEKGLEICGKQSRRSEIIPTVLDLKPDVLLTDMLMDGEDNLEIIRALRRSHRGLGIVVVSMFNPENYGDDSIEAGADAFLTKAESTDTIVSTIRKVAKMRKRMGGAEPGAIEQ